MLHRLVLAPADWPAWGAEGVLQTQPADDLPRPLYRPERSAAGDVAGVDYAMLIKTYEAEVAGFARYSSPAVMSCHTSVEVGNPERKHVSTSYIERQNLTMRMQMRRFTRLTNGFSKKIENHKHAIALHYFNYNFCRVHQTVKAPPAMAAGITDHVWELSEPVALLEAEENKAIDGGSMKRGKYRSKNSA